MKTLRTIVTITTLLACLVASSSYANRGGGGVLSIKNSSQCPLYVSTNGSYSSINPGYNTINTNATGTLSALLQKKYAAIANFEIFINTGLEGKNNFVWIATATLKHDSYTHLGVSNWHFNNSKVPAGFTANSTIGTVGGVNTMNAAIAGTMANCH